MFKVALDVMGGDYAPHEIVLGAVQAKRALDVELILVGKRGEIEHELLQMKGPGAASLQEFEIVDAAEVVLFDENPSVVKERHDASIRVICDLVNEGQADACLTMGHTGAGIIASLITFGRFAQVLRPCVGLVYFGLQPNTMLVDGGAIIDCKPEYLLQFARMGTIYMKKMLGLARPTVGLMSNGREDNKGNELTRAAFVLLQESRLNFIGNVEGYDLPRGTANVIVMDGMWGNIAVKLSEALSEELLGRMSTRFTEAGMPGKAHSILNEFQEMMDYTRVGAGPVLGVERLMFIGHGRSRAAAVVGALRNTIHALDVDLLGALREGLQEPDRF